MTRERGLRRQMTGTVTSDKMQNTVLVAVSRRFKHPIYGKYIQRRKQYMAHDPENACRVGDRILIEECRPMSRHKRWLVREILERAV